MGVFKINETNINDLAEKILSTSSVTKNRFFQSVKIPELGEYVADEVLIQSLDPNNQTDITFNVPRPSAETYPNLKVFVTAIGTSNIDGVFPNEPGTYTFNNNDCTVTVSTDSIQIALVWSYDQAFNSWTTPAGLYGIVNTLTWTKKYDFAADVGSDYIYSNNIVGNKLKVNGVATTIAAKGYRPLNTLRLNLVSYGFVLGTFFKPTDYGASAVTTTYYFYRRTSGTYKGCIFYTQNSSDIDTDNGKRIASLDEFKPMWLKFLIGAAGGSGASDSYNKNSGSGGGGGAAAHVLLKMDRVWRIEAGSCGGPGHMGGTAIASADTFLYDHTNNVKYLTIGAGQKGRNTLDNPSSGEPVGGTVTQHISNNSFFRVLDTMSGGNGKARGNDSGGGGFDGKTLTAYNPENLTVTLSSRSVGDGYAGGGASPFMHGQSGPTSTSQSNANANPAGKVANPGAGGAGVLYTASTTAGRNAGWGGSPVIRIYY